ncbi:MAG: SMC-Scp complex subunit ScpB [Candidatus Atribacteria bacterium]|nr:SMC-Scp complex subunit ScpB [Candidatus Atribacteria bacterium]
MKKEEYIHAIESILFVSPKPVKVDKIALSLNLDKVTTNELLLELENELKDTGINLYFDTDKVTLVPNSSYRRFFEKFVRKKKVTLSRNLLEVVGLLLKKKRTKEEIDRLRGVNSSRMINELIKLGYVEKEFFEGKVYYKLTDAFFASLPDEAKDLLDSKLFKI